MFALAAWCETCTARAVNVPAAPAQPERAPHARVVVDTGRASVDALVDALAALASSARLSVSRGSLRRSVCAALAARPPIEWPDVLRSAAATVGLAVSIYELSPADLAAHASKLRSLVTLVERAGRLAAIAILPGEGQLMLLEVRRRARPASTDARAIGELLGVATDEPTVFAAAEPSASLDVMRASRTNGVPRARLFALLRLERDDLWVTMTYAVFIGLLSLAAPLVVQTLVNTLAFGAFVQPLVVLTMLLFAGVAFSAALRALQAWVVERIQQRLFVRTALDLAHRLPRVHAVALRSAHGPELLNRFFEVMTMQKGAATLLVDGIAIALQTIIGLILLSVYHPLLLALGIILSASIALIVLVVGKRATPTAVNESKTRYAVAAWLQEMSRHRATFGSEEGAVMGVSHAEDLTRDWLGARRKHYAIVFRQIAGALALEAVASAALLGVGGALVIERQLTLGQLVAAELIVATVVAGFAKLGKYFESVYDLLASVDKIGTLVDLPLERAGATLQGDGPASLVLGDVRIERGGRLGVYAADSRQTRGLTDVLTGDADPGEVRFEIDGSDARDLSPAAIRSAMIVVRGPEIFSGTIEDNLTMERPISPVALREALERLEMWDAIAALPDRTRTRVSTHAPSLTRDQALRLTLARALLAEPRILVIDHAFDGLPAHARERLVRALAERPWTFVLVSASEATSSCFGSPRTIGERGPS